jgi:hypothetical protein
VLRYLSKNYHSAPNTHFLNHLQCCLVTIEPITDRAFYPRSCSRFKVTVHTPLTHTTLPRNGKRELARRFRSPLPLLGTGLWGGGARGGKRAVAPDGGKLSHRASNAARRGADHGCVPAAHGRRPAALELAACAAHRRHCGAHQGRQAVPRQEPPRPAGRLRQPGHPGGGANPLLRCHPARPKAELCKPAVSSIQLHAPDSAPPDQFRAGRKTSSVARCTVSCRLVRPRGPCIH